MSTVVAIDRPSGAAIVLFGPKVLSLPLTRLSPDAVFQIGFPDWNFNLSANIVDQPLATDTGEVTLQAVIDEYTEAGITLSGRLINNGRRLQVEQVVWDMRPRMQRPEDVFFTSTLIAMYDLSDQICLQIPEYELDLRLQSTSTLKSISLTLEERQLAYWLMVIERATGHEFAPPSVLSGEQVRTIRFIFHAIVDRSFVWPIETVTVDVPASQERLAQLPPDDRPTRQLIGPSLDTKTLLGHSITLGNETIEIEDMIIEHADEVRRELAQNDGHPVKVVVRSLSGRARINAPEAPRLPDAPWDSRIQTLIDLEPQLDARLAERYHALAAATLADLTEEEKTAVTARPELDEEAFLMDDLDGENN
jgi:hypothetical protein